MPNSVGFVAERPSGGFESGTTENCAALPRRLPKPRWRADAARCRQKDPLLSCWS